MVVDLHSGNQPWQRKIHYFSISASMVLHVSISFHGHIWLLEANLFGEGKQHIFCKFGITPRSWISFMRVGMWTTTPLPMRFLQASMAPVGSSGWTLRLSWLCDDSCRGIGTGSSPVYWRFCTPLRLRWSKTKYFKHFLSYSYNIYIYLFGFEPLRMVMFDKISLATAWHRDMIEATNIRGTLFPKKRWGLNRSEASNWGMAASWNCAQFSSGTMR